MPRMQVFTLKSLCLIEGLEEDFERLREAIVADCQARPEVQKKRELCLKVQFQPTDRGDNVRVRCFIEAKVPTREAPTYRMMTTQARGLKFSPGAPETPDQSTFDLEE